MSRRTTVAAMAAVASLALAGGAQAAETSYFFQCTGAAKYQGDQASVAWSTTKPAASFTTGAGCGSADVGPFKNRLAGQSVDFIGGGAHSGRIDTINVELHSGLVSYYRALGGDMGVEAELTIDDEPFELAAFRAAPEASATGATYKYVFSFSRKKPAGAPAAPPLAGEGDHTVRLRFSSAFLDHQNAWLWGASEVPAGIVVNPPKLANPKIVFP